MESEATNHLDNVGDGSVEITSGPLKGQRVECVITPEQIGLVRNRLEVLQLFLTPNTPRASVVWTRSGIDALAALLAAVEEADARWCAMFKRRVAVEQEMLDAAKRRETGEVVSAEQLRKWALRLGTPDEIKGGA